MALTSLTTPSHYDPAMQLSIACDANQVGAGAVPFHAHEYDVQYKQSAKPANVDGLSRLPLNNTEQDDELLYMIDHQEAIITFA